ncbi:hypothetical protein P5V15_008466 [Pogonomyrmex californicus]
MKKSNIANNNTRMRIHASYGRGSYDPVAGRRISRIVICPFGPSNKFRNAGVSAGIFADFVAFLDSFRNLGFLSSFEIHFRPRSSDSSNFSVLLVRAKDKEFVDRL